MPLSATARPSVEQSEQLESILRYLAPSCRLLKKTSNAPILSTSGATVKSSSSSSSCWQPVSDVFCDNSVDRCAFLRSLGLAPTAVIVDEKSNNIRSRVSHLRIAKRPASSVSRCKPMPYTGLATSKEPAKPVGANSGPTQIPTSSAATDTKNAGPAEIKPENVAAVKHPVKNGNGKTVGLKTDTYGNVKSSTAASHGRPSGSSKMPLTHSKSINVNGDFKVSLDAKEVRTLMNEQKKSKDSPASSSGVDQPKKRGPKRRRVDSAGLASEESSPASTSSDAVKPAKVERRNENLNATLALSRTRRRMMKSSKFRNDDGVYVKLPLTGKPKKTGLGACKKRSPKLPETFPESVSGDSSSNSVLKSKIVSKKLLNKMKVCVTSALLSHCQ